VIVVIPAEIADTTPVPLMAPIAGRLLDHVPPDGSENNADVCPMQANNDPVMPPGKGLTVTGIVLTHPNLL